MAFVMTNLGKVKFLELALNDNPANAITIRLFKNSHDPVITDDIDSFEEVTDHGYQALPLSRYVSQASPGYWLVEFVEDNAGDYVQATALAQTFVLNDTGAEQSVYGYYLTVTDSEVKLIGAEKFNLPINITAGGSITIHSKIIY